MPLNYAISLNKKLNDDVEENDNELMEVIDNGYNPFEDFVNKEYYKEIAGDLYNKLSTHEKDVLNEYLTGKSYAEIAQKLNCQEKSVDTALTRIRRKGSDLMQDYTKLSRRENRSVQQAVCTRKTLIQQEDNCPFVYSTVSGWHTLLQERNHLRVFRISLWIQERPLGTFRNHPASTESAA